MNFSEVEKIKKLIFNLYSFNATVIYRDSNFRKKCINVYFLYYNNNVYFLYYAV